MMKRLIGHCFHGALRDTEMKRPNGDKLWDQEGVQKEGLVFVGGGAIRGGLFQD